MGVQIQGDNWTRFGIYFLLFLVQVYSKKKKKHFTGDTFNTSTEYILL